MQKTLHIYVCSTYRDLVSERKALVDKLEDFSSQFQGLTFSCPRAIQQLENCKLEIAQSQILVLVVGHLQGVIAPGLDISYGEAEYNEGLRLGKKILVYFRDEKIGIYPIHFERDPKRIQQLKNFKDKLHELHEPKIFTDLASLTSLLTDDITKLAGEYDLEVKPAGANTRTKGQTQITRKISTVNRPLIQIPVDLPQEKEYSTKTIPVFQKALATPFYHRKSGLGKITKGLILGILMIIAASIALAEFRNYAKPKPAVIASTVPVKAIPIIADTAVINVPETNPPQDSVSAVLLIDDTDTSKVILLKAQNGSGEEKFIAGQMYEEGKRVRRNDSLAFWWYRQAADKGLPEAQFKTAMMYRIGKGTVRSSIQAARWFQASANQGYPQAQVKLGQLYQSGKGVARNEATAFKWFLKAAEQKDPDAEKILAELKED